MQTNMETLMLKGQAAAFIDKNEARQNMQIIDRISQDVFGKTEYFEFQADNVSSINLRSNQYISDIIKRFS